ncbi:hypothetical protein D3C84_985200 [compost metagenome]
MLDIGRHVGGANDEQAHILLGGGDDQFAALVRILKGHDAGLGEQRQGVVENAALGQRDGEHGTGFPWLRPVQGLMHSRSQPALFGPAGTAT